MASHIVQNPAAGCIVEFMQGNEPQIAWVMEEQKGKLRLFLPNRREKCVFWYVVCIRCCLVL